MNSLTDNAGITQERFTFVTVLAWIFIALTGFSTLITGLQNVMIRLMFSSEQMHMQISAEQLESMPAVARFMFENMNLLFLGFFIVSAVTLIASVGLLKRKNWARLTFMGVMALAIIWNIGGLVVHHSMIPGLAEFPHDTPADFRDQFETMRLVTTVAAYVFALGFSALFGWILWKLTRRDIAGEFTRSRYAHKNRESDSDGPGSTET